MEIKDSIKGSNIKKGVWIGRGGFAEVFRLESFSKIILMQPKCTLNLHTLMMVILIVYTVKELRMNVPGTITKYT